MPHCSETLLLTNLMLCPWFNLLEHNRDIEEHLEVGGVLSRGVWVYGCGAMTPARAIPPSVIPNIGLEYLPSPTRRTCPPACNLWP
jgi:hypothetical protein